MENNQLLTIIIPFRNEQEEVENTIDSILEFSNNDVDIIVINDASDDHYDYEQSLANYNIIYIKNLERMGAAACKDLGVNYCRTPYFLLLDAHMRFYDHIWVKKITQLLIENDRSLLCSQTKVLRKEDGKVFVDEKKNAMIYQGAFVYFNYGMFAPKWVIKKTEYEDDDVTQPIACVLGAGYACSKAYWEYLKGLSGLSYYGNEEPYISIKVWLEGGRCLLMKNVIIGHIYRDQSPYYTEPYTRVYNWLLINETIVNNECIQKKINAELKTHPLYCKSYRLFYTNRKQIALLKKYYSNIFKHDFSYFEQINSRYTLNENNINKNETLWHDIANHLLIKCYSMPDSGLLKGKTGVIIFLFHYSRHIGSKRFYDLSKLLLNDVCDSLNANMSIDFETGLSGIGWSIQYLFLQNFLSGDINDILEDFDCKIKETDISNMRDFSLKSGLGGIVLYINARLYTIAFLHLPNPFDPLFLHLLYTISKTILDDEHNVSDSIDVFVDYILYYEGEKNLSAPSIYDVTHLEIPNDYDLTEYSLGLNGSANVGLKIYLTLNK